MSRGGRVLETTMVDLVNAEGIRRKYLDIDFDVFAKMVEEYIGRKIPQMEKDDFRYCELTNIDFFNTYI